MLSNALKSGLWVLAATAVMGCFEPAPDSVFGVSQTPEWGGEPVNAGDGTKSVCVGVKPSPEAFKASPGPIMAPPEETETETEPEATPPDAVPAEREEIPADKCSPGNCEGEFPVDWQLTDFQPQSCGFGATYGLGPYKGRVTVAALFASW